MLSYKPNYLSTTINNKKIEFRPWNTADEKDYLIATESETIIDSNLLYEHLIKPCLADKDVVLTEIERKLLIIEMRKKSLGSTFPLKFTCSECKQINDADIDLSSTVKYSKSTLDKITIENIEFIFGAPKTNILVTNTNNIKNKIEHDFNNLLICITAINDGKLHNTFTFEELSNYINSLPVTIYDELKNYYNSNKEKFYLECSTNCLPCGHNNVINLESIPNFLWE